MGFIKEDLAFLIFLLTMKLIFDPKKTGVRVILKLFDKMRNSKDEISVDGTPNFSIKEVFRWDWKYLFWQTYAQKSQVNPDTLVSESCTRIACVQFASEDFWGCELVAHFQVGVALVWLLWQSFSYPFYLTSHFIITDQFKHKNVINVLMQFSKCSKMFHKDSVCHQKQLW